MLILLKHIYQTLDQHLLSSELNLNLISYFLIKINLIPVLINIWHINKTMNRYLYLHPVLLQLLEFQCSNHKNQSFPFAIFSFCFHLGFTVQLLTGFVAVLFSHKAQNSWDNKSKLFHKKIVVANAKRRFWFNWACKRNKWMKLSAAVTYAELCVFQSEWSIIFIEMTRRDLVFAPRNRFTSVSNRLKMITETPQRIYNKR